MPSPSRGHLVLRGLVLAAVLPFAAGAALATPAPREPLHIGVKVGTMFSLRDVAAEADWASGLDVFYWHDAGSFIVEPRLGFRFDPDVSKNGGWESAAADVGFFAVHRRGEVSLFAGGGVGLRYYSERTYELFQTGSVLVVEHRHLYADSALAPAAYLRVGMLSAPWDGEGISRYTLAVDLESAYATLNGAKHPVTVQLLAGLVF